MSSRGRSNRKPASAATNLLAGGGAGMMDALICYPLDTIKVRMQLSHKAIGEKGRGFIPTALDIARRETLLGFYKGLGAVAMGIMPKIAVRFTAYDWYQQLLAHAGGLASSPAAASFISGMAAGITEAVTVVTPMEVIKIRLQAQYLNRDAHQKYRNAPHAALTILREEGPGALWRGVGLTALRQGTNQAANFAAYTELKAFAQRHSVDPSAPLPSSTIMAVGLIAGAVGPLCNAPIDTVKTRLQRSSTHSDGAQSATKRVLGIISNTFQEGGVRAFWAGTLPRVARVAPGQAITFAVYEFLRSQLESAAWFAPFAKIG